MTGELNETSRAIGALEQSVDGLKGAQERANELFDQHCKDDNEHHDDNLGNFSDLKQDVQEVRNDVMDLKSDVKDVKVQIDGLRRDLTARSPIQPPIPQTMPKSHQAALVSLGVILLAILVWLVQTLLGSGVSWLINHVKFGP